MPLFSSRSRSEDEAANQRTGNLFTRSWSSRSTSSNRKAHNSGFFSRHSPFDESNPHNDHTIVAARQKIHDAEAAEKEADKALRRARIAVKEARDHIKFLEREATNE
jgi:hypothetical protein